MAIQYASKELRNDKTLALLAVSKNPSSLRYFSKNIRKDREVVLSAIKVDGTSIRFARHYVQN